MPISGNVKRRMFTCKTFKAHAVAYRLQELQNSNRDFRNVQGYLNSYTCRNFTMFMLLGYCFIDTFKTNIALYPYQNI